MNYKDSDLSIKFTIYHHIFISTPDIANANVNDVKNRPTSQINLTKLDKPEKITILSSQFLIICYLCTSISVKTIKLNYKWHFNVVS